MKPSGALVVLKAAKNALCTTNYRVSLVYSHSTGAEHNTELRMGTTEEILIQ